LEDEELRQSAVLRSGKVANAARKKEAAVPTPVPVQTEDRDDHFVIRNGVKCAGAHLIIDLYNASRLDDIDHIEATLRRCVDAAGATLLHIHLHHFEPNGGVSGVAVLAESHISIHSWPENGYAALDVFMCGKATPDACVPVLRKAFSPKKIAVSEHLRGQGAA
jgi:S-adenosylmethionine decarboxylase